LPQAISQRFAYDEGSQLIGEYGTTNRDYIWMAGLPVAVVDTSGSTNTISYVHADGLGTPRVITDASGTTQWQWSYQSNPFGEQQPTSNTGYIFNLRFPGQYYDAESRLAYNLYRNYDASIGRYAQSDPQGLSAGASTYGYTHSSPLMRTDPYGLDDTVCSFDRAMCGMQNNATADEISKMDRVNPHGSGWINAMILTYEWATGTGPQHRDFGPDSTEAANMANAPGVLAAEALYRRKLAQTKASNCVENSPVTVTNYAVRFGLKGLLTSGLNSTEQFIGSYRIDIYPLGETQMDVIINNTTSFKSFQYDTGPDWNRSTFGPMGNMSQTIHVTANNQ
jgi:RHS repeat-associated protein